MNPATLAEAKKRFLHIRKSAQNYRNLDVVVCPPSPFIAPLAELGQKSRLKVGIGAQDISIFEAGSSKTGEVSVEMVNSSGANYIIIGHSERRALGDNGQTVSLKIREALKTKMNIIICVGEKERDADGGYLEVIKAQLSDALVNVGRSQFHQVIIAYEPVWAIGRKDNVAITSYDLHQMVVYIKKYLRESFGDTISSMTKILYGGSVTAENAEDIIWNGEVDGLLIGRASYEGGSFSDIFYAISKAEKSHGTKVLKKTLKKAKENKGKKRRK